VIAVFMAIRLAAATSALWGVPLDRALPAAVAAVTYADDYGPELILAIGAHETGLDPTRVGSRGECGTGQVAHRRDRARLCALAAASYAESARQSVVALNEARALCRRHGRRDVGCALRVYGSGVRGQPWRWRSSRAEREFRAMERKIMNWGHAKGTKR
jgi:hypothetical protein